MSLWGRRRCSPWLAVFTMELEMLELKHVEGTPCHSWHWLQRMDSIVQKAPSTIVQFGDFPVELDPVIKDVFISSLRESLQPTGLGLGGWDGLHQPWHQSVPASSWPEVSQFCLHHLNSLVPLAGGCLQAVGGNVFPHLGNVYFSPPCSSWKIQD